MSLVDYLIPIAIGLGVIAVLSVSFAWTFARLYCKPQRHFPTQTPAEFDMQFESLNFVSHGVSLEGWFISCDTAPTPQPVIIMAHGWSNNRTQMLPLARQLHDAGFGVFLYDARGHGASGADGPITIAKFAEDLLAAVDYVAGRSDVDATRLGIVGHSLGGSAAIVVTSISPRVRVVVSSSAFADPVTLTWGFMRALHIPRWPFLWLVCRFIERWLGTTMTDIAPRNRIGQITVPLLLLHGDSDRFILSSNVEILLEYARREQTQYSLIPGRGHSDILRDPGFGMEIVGFLNNHLRSSPMVKQIEKPDQGIALDLYSSKTTSTFVPSAVDI